MQLGPLPLHAVFSKGEDPVVRPVSTYLQQWSDDMHGNVYE